jgi:hypothetical protein
MAMTTDQGCNHSRSLRPGYGADEQTGPTGQAGRASGRMPIWLAALMASRCQAMVDGEDHSVYWDCIAGRAFYTNHRAVAERIEPLGVHLQGGHTLAVYWRPGATHYTVEVYC